MVGSGATERVGMEDWSLERSFATNDVLCGLTMPLSAGGIRHFLSDAYGLHNTEPAGMQSDAYGTTSCGRIGNKMVKITKCCAILLTRTPWKSILMLNESIGFNCASVPCF